MSATYDIMYDLTPSHSIIKLHAVNDTFLQVTEEDCIKYGGGSFQNEVHSQHSICVHIFQGGIKIHITLHIFMLFVWNIYLYLLFMIRY